MKLSNDWLGDWVDLDLSVTDLAERLTNVGLTVDGVEQPGETLGGVIVGRVEEVSKHPNADRLSVCTVHDGRAGHRVVCGAPNVRAGGLYPFAPVGATLPGGFEIRKARIRGEDSAGMLCSEKELGLSDDAAGLMELTDAEPGCGLVEHLGLTDSVLEIDVPYNRPDWLSVRGVAREVAAMRSLPLRVLESAPPETDHPASAEVTVEVESAEDCPLYGARIVRGVRIGPSPAWLRRRLEAIGQRSINNVVDVTNYVLHTYGQPIHSFDLGRLRGGRIVVRRARADERLTTLDGAERTLDPRVLIIADGEGAVALAGIMGGESTEVTDGTTDLLLESAHFAALLTRDGARSLGMETEASIRFGRGIDGSGTLLALDHTARWIQEVAGGEVLGGRVVAGTPQTGGRRSVLRVARVERVLGKAVSEDEVRGILDRLGFDPSREESPAGAASIACRVPPWRLDVDREEDLIEEIARFHGYEKFEERQFNRSAVPAVRNPIEKAISGSAAALVGLGFREVLTSVFQSSNEAETTRSWSWIEGEVVPLLNAKSQDASAMRTALWPGLLRVAGLNVRHGQESFRLFEHGKVFRMVAGVPAERWELAGIVHGPLSEEGWQGKAVPFDLFALKGLLGAWGAHLRLGGGAHEPCPAGPLLSTEALQVTHDSGLRMRAGRIAPPIATRWDVPEALYLFSIDFEHCLSLGRPTVSYTEPSRFPVVKRDLAFVVSSRVTHAELEATILAAGGGLVRSVRLFDLYEGQPIPAGKKSLAYSLSFQSAERSLKNEEVDERVAAIVGRLSDSHGARLRDS